MLLHLPEECCSALIIKAAIRRQPALGRQPPRLGRRQPAQVIPEADIHEGLASYRFGRLFVLNGVDQDLGSRSGRGWVLAGDQHPSVTTPGSLPTLRRQHASIG